MTPMVDLGFLLIAFFIITTEMSRPVVMKLFVPREGPVTNIPDSKSLTILIGTPHKIYYYLGTEELTFKDHKIFQTGFSENQIGAAIRQKQTSLNNFGSGQDSLVILIKPGENSSYKNIVDVLDEMIINHVKRYSLADLSETEKRFIEGK